jgi:hypothetical protein
VRFPTTKELSPSGYRGVKNKTANSQLEGDSFHHFTGGGLVPFVVLYYNHLFIKRLWRFPFGGSTFRFTESLSMK